MDRLHRLNHALLLHFRFSSLLRHFHHFLLEQNTKTDLSSLGHHLPPNLLSLLLVTPTHGLHLHVHVVDRTEACLQIDVGRFTRCRWRRRRKRITLGQFSQRSSHALQDQGVQRTQLRVMEGYGDYELVATAQELVGVPNVGRNVALQLQLLVFHLAMNLVTLPLQLSLILLSLYYREKVLRINLPPVLLLRASRFQIGGHHAESSTILTAALDALADGR